MTPVTFGSNLDTNGYPAWVTALGDEETGIGLYVVRGLEPFVALQLMGAEAEQIRRVELVAATPEQAASSLALEALHAPPGTTSVLLATLVREWTVVFDAGGRTVMDNSMVGLLAADRREAASCSVSGNGDTHLAYAVDGEELFWTGEPVSVFGLDRLPAGLRSAAEAAAIPRRRGDDDTDTEWNPAENFRVVCALAGVHLTGDDVRKLPFLAATLRVE